MMRPLTLQEARYIAHQLALELLDYSEEPIPPFDTRYPHILESCLEQPFQQFGGVDLYPGIFKKAAVLFFLVTKNHPFKNGNKRMALTLTLTFLFVNGYFLEISTNDLYELSLRVAANSEQPIEEAVGVLTQLFESTGTRRPDVDSTAE
jgi:death-on-curing family protein